MHGCYTVKSSSQWLGTLPLKPLQMKNTLSKTSNIQSKIFPLLLCLYYLQCLKTHKNPAIGSPYQYQISNIYIYPNIKLKRLGPFFCVFFWCPSFLTKRVIPYKPPSKIRKHSTQWHSTLVEATPSHNWRSSVESRCQMGTKIVILRAHRACKRLLHRWDGPMVAMKLPICFFRYTCFFLLSRN